MIKENHLKAQRCTAALIALVLIVFIPVAAGAATNSSFSMYDLTDLGNPRFGEHLYVYTQSSYQPEVFSVNMPDIVREQGVLNWDYNEFEITYQSSAAIGEWTEETVYVWRSMDGDTYPDTLYATLTGADADSIVYVFAIDIHEQ